jgi:hypothetical protein
MNFAKYKNEMDHLMDLTTKIYGTLEKIKKLKKNLVSEKDINDFLSSFNKVLNKDEIQQLNVLITPGEYETHPDLVEKYNFEVKGKNYNYFIYMYGLEENLYDTFIQLKNYEASLQILLDQNFQCIPTNPLEFVNEKRLLLAKNFALSLK